jgi:hypothetical protein
MKKWTFKKLVVIAASVTLFLGVVLIVHIYLVTRPAEVSAPQRVMARIDFRQDIAQADADKITAWLYTQSGVDHVLCNAGADIAVFTFSPAQTSADAIVSAFKAATGYRAERFMPGEAEMRSGCPVAVGSWSDKLFNLIKRI